MFNDPFITLQNYKFILFIASTSDTLNLFSLVTLIKEKHGLRYCNLVLPINLRWLWNLPPPTMRERERERERESFCHCELAMLGHCILQTLLFYLNDLINIIRSKTTNMFLLNNYVYVRSSVHVFFHYWNCWRYQV